MFAHLSGLFVAGVDIEVTGSFGISAISIPFIPHYRIRLNGINKRSGKTNATLRRGLIVTLTNFLISVRSDGRIRI